MRDDSKIENKATSAAAGGRDQEADKVDPTTLISGIKPKSDSPAEESQGTSDPAVSETDVAKDDAGADAEDDEED